MQRPRMPPLAALPREDTEAICYADGRKVGTPGHERARAHLVQRLMDMGCTVLRPDG